MNWWVFLLCLTFKRGTTMKEYVFVTQAILYSVAISLLLSPTRDYRECKAMVRIAYWDSFPSVLTLFKLKVHG